MTRLRHDHRDQITRRVIAHAFDDKQLHLSKQAFDLAKQGRDLALELDGKLELFYQCPEGWFHHEIDVRINSTVLRLFSRLTLPLEMVHRIEIDEKAMPNFIHAVKTCKERQRELEKQREQMRNRTMSVLRSFSTFKQIKEGWPEIWPLASDLVDPGSPTMLPSNLSELNSQLGLPPGQER